MKLFRELLLILLVLGIVPASAQETATRTLSLSEALQLALDRHVDVVVANERVVQALARVDQSASPLLPQLNAEASQKRQTRDLRSTGFSLPGEPLAGPFNVYDARVKLKQTIFDAAAMSRFKASREGHSLSVAEAAKAREDTLALVAHLFIEARRSAKNLEVYHAMLCRDKKQMSIMHTRFRSGTSSPLDMKKARADYAKSLFNWQNAKADAVERRLDLAAALGLPQNENIVFTWDEKLSERPFPANVKKLDEQPDVAVARREFELKKSQAVSERREYWPQVSVTGDYGPSGISPGPQDSSETYSLGVQATIPIFEGGLRPARVKEAESRTRESESILKDTRQQTQALITARQQTLEQAKVLLAQKDAEIEVGREELVLAKQRFFAGHGSSAELTNAKVRAAFLEDQKDEAVAYYILAKIDLARASGQVERFLMENKQ